MRRRGEIATEFFANRIGSVSATKQVLQELRQMNPPLRLGLATSSVSASARPFLDRHKLTPFFEVIVTGEEVRARQTASRYLPARRGRNLMSPPTPALPSRIPFRHRCGEGREHARRRHPRYPFR